MDGLIEAIRAAVAEGASDEARAAGVAACRTILTALQSHVGQPMAAPHVPPIAAAVAALRGVPPDQLLDIAIARLRAALPPGADAPATAPLNFHMVPAPPLGGKP